MDNLEKLIDKIADNIEKRRNNLKPKLSVEKLSREANISTLTLMKIKNKQTENITIATLTGIANALNCTVKDLLE